MLWSCGALTRFIRQAMSPALVSEEAWPAESAFDPWPHQSMVMAGAEVRLGAARESGVDLAFCVRAGIGRERLLGGQGYRVPQDVGDGVGRFLALWAEPESIAHAHVPEVWLEFDHGPIESGMPVPFLTFMIGAGLTDAFSESERRDEIRSLVWTGLTALLGRADLVRIEAILAMLDALPPDGRLRHVAAMPHRGRSAARIIVSMQRESIVGYLARLGTTMDFDSLGSTLERLCPSQDLVSLNLDVGDCVHSALGIELYWPKSQETDERWSRLLAELVAAEICSADQREALARWPNEDDDPSPFCRQLLVKLLVRDGRLTGAKGYLTLKPRLLLLGNPEHKSPRSALDL